MREIKFRAWLIQEKRMCLVQTMSFTRMGNVQAVQLAGEEYFVGMMFVELLQYIGREDRNEQEMCEGDIVNYLDNTSQGLVKKTVVIKDIRHLPDFSCSKWEEVIGNI